MSSFLEDFGRSNAPQAVSSLANLAIETGKQEVEGQRGLAVTAMDLARLEETKAQNQFTRTIQGAEEARKATEFTYRAEKLKAESAAMNAITPIDQVLRNATPTTRQMLVDWGQKNGFVKDYGGGVLGIKEMHKKAAMDMLKGDGEFGLSLADAHIRDIAGEKAKLLQDANDLKDTKPDSKDIPILEKKIALLDKAQKGALTNRDTLNEKLREQMLLKSEKWLDVADPASSTGWSKQDPSTGEKVKDTAPPASAGGNTPHTTTLEKGPDGKKTPGYQHTWAWDPATKQFSKYVGPHGKTTGTATLTAAESANQERAIKGYQSVITAKGALEKMAAGGVVPTTIAGQGDPAMTALLGMFAGKAIDKKTKDSLVAELEKIRLVRERQLKAMGWSTEMAAPPAAAGATGGEWQSYLNKGTE